MGAAGTMPSRLRKAANRQSAGIVAKADMGDRHGSAGVPPAESNERPKNEGSSKNSEDKASPKRKKRSLHKGK